MAEVRWGRLGLRRTAAGSVHYPPDRLPTFPSNTERSSRCAAGSTWGRGATVRPADRKPRPALNFARDLTGVTKLDAHGGGGLMGRE